MRNIYKRAAAVLVSGACVLSTAVPAMAELKPPTTVKSGKTGTLTLNYKDDSEGKKPVVGAEFTLYKIGAMVMPVTGPVISSSAVKAVAGNGETGTYIGSNEDGVAGASSVAGTTGATGTSGTSAADANGTSAANGTASGVNGANGAGNSGSGNGATGTSGANGSSNGSASSGNTSDNYTNTFTVADRILNIFASVTKAATGTKKKATSVASDTVNVKTYYKPLIKGVKADYSVDPVKVEKKVRAAYRKGVKGGKHYRLKTNASGYAKLKGISQGLYLAVETKPAKEHFASIPFIVTMPQMIYKNDGSKQGWHFDVVAYPKSLPGGDLKISKKVTGNDGEKNKMFHFNINLDLSKAKSTAKKTSADRYTDKYASGRAPNGYHTAQSFIKKKNYGRTYDRAEKKYKYTTSDGRKGTIGTKGTIALKSGQTATIKCIPIGTAYKVTEQEANRNRYKTKVKNEEGAIRQHKPETVSFINNRTKPVHHPAKPGRPSKPGHPGHRVKTGDNAKLTVYIAMLAAAAAAIILSLRKIIRRRKED